MAPNVFFLFDSKMVPGQDRQGEGNVRSLVSQVIRTCSERQVSCPAAGRGLLRLIQLEGSLCFFPSAELCPEAAFGSWDLSQLPH